MPVAVVAAIIAVVSIAVAVVWRLHEKEVAILRARIEVLEKEAEANKASVVMRELQAQKELLNLRLEEVSARIAELQTVGGDTGTLCGELADAATVIRALTEEQRKLAAQARSDELFRGEVNEILNDMATRWTQDMMWRYFEVLKQSAEIRAAHDYNGLSVFTHTPLEEALKIQLEHVRRLGLEREWDKWRNRKVSKASTSRAA